MMEHILEKNWINFLGKVMKENGYSGEVRGAEDIVSNLFYLSKEDGKGSRFISLQYKRILEKLICGLFNSSLEYEDGKDVYFEEIIIDGQKTLVCNANVFWVQHLPDGQKKVLGHGFHALTLNEVFGGDFISTPERISKWKATAIGAAKSRALHDGGIGLEFYGDIISEETKAETPKEDAKAETKEEKAKPEKEYSQLGLPVPAPKKGRKKAEEAPTPVEVLSDEPKHVDISDGYENTPDGVLMKIEKAFEQVADIGNCKGMNLGQIYETSPKSILFLIRNSQIESVREGALAIMKSDEDLTRIFNKQ